MTLGLPTVDWDESWAKNDLPTGNGNTDFYRFNVPGVNTTFVSSPVYESLYSVNVSGLYASWTDASILPPKSDGAPLLNTGIALCPTPLYPNNNNVNEFRSSNYIDTTDDSHIALSKTLRPILAITYPDPTPTNIKMPLPGMAPPSEQKWLVKTEIGGRDCNWSTSGIEVDKAHSDFNSLYGGTFFSLDIPKRGLFR